VLYVLMQGRKQRADESAITPRESRRVTVETLS
jgi:hypothetical protein